MLRNLSITLLLALGLVACGSGSKKPAAEEPAAEEETSDDSLDDLGDSDMPVENEHCCCDTDGTLADMSIGECDAAGGVCTEDPNACYE